MTGASAGISFELATGLAARGHDIVGVGASDRIDTLPERLPTVSVTPVRVAPQHGGGREGALGAL